MGILFKDDKKPGRDPSLPQYTPPAETAQPSAPPEERRSYIGGVTRTRARSATSTVAPAVKGSESNVVDPQFDEDIRKALSRVDTPGYAELLEQDELLKDGYQDPAVRIRKVAQIVTRMLRITNAQLAKSVRQIIDALDNEKTEFEAALSQQASDTMSASSERTRELEKRKDEIAAEIRRLTEEQGTVDSELRRLQADAENVRSQVAQVRSQFLGTYNIRRKEAQDILDRVESIS